MAGNAARVRSVLAAEVAAIRQTRPDLDPRDLTTFTASVLVRLVGLLAVGAVPLIVIRNGGVVDDLLVPVLGSAALTAICAAVITWLGAIVLSGLVVMVLYRMPPGTASRLVVRTLITSFERISDITASFALLALVAGLVAMAIGLPTRHGDELANPVLDDLLAVQLAVLLAALALSFLSEAARCAAEIVDTQSLLLAWPWALVIVSLSWVLTTTVGPVEATRMMATLLHEWLPAFIDGRSREQMIAEVVPGWAHWVLAFGPLPLIGLIWAVEAARHDGFAQLRGFVQDDPR